MQSYGEAMYGKGKVGNRMAVAKLCETYYDKGVWRSEKFAFKICNRTDGEGES